MDEKRPRRGYVWIDDSIAHHPKFVRAGPAALALFVAGLCYCNRYGSEGLIPKAEVPHLVPGLGERRAMELAERLASNGREPSWIDEGEHYRVHDYEQSQPGRREEARAGARRAQNAARQRRYRERQAARGGGRGGGVTRYVTGQVAGELTGDVTGQETREVTGDVMGHVAGDVAREVTSDLTREVTPAVRGDVTGVAPLPEPLPPSSVAVLSRGDIYRAPAREQRDRRSEFAVWFAVYPRQEGEMRARQAWLTERELPPLGVLLERLEEQKAAKPEAQFWPTAERYVRERRWGDRPPAAALPRRSADAERRALGSDPARRQRLREISEEARFDPEAKAEAEVKGTGHG